MTRIIFFICVVLQVSLLHGQESSEIEKKYDFIEVWGLENQSKNEFLKQLMSHPEGICQQSLTKMGFPDGNKIPIPFSNKIILTLRKNPRFATNQEFKEVGIKELQILENFQREFKKLGIYERQQVPLFINFYEKGQHQILDNKFSELKSEFSSYGIILDKENIIRSLEIYTSYKSQFSSSDFLSLLYNSHKTELIRDAIIFLGPNFLGNETELLRLLPLLLEKDSGVQPLISSFIENFEGQINWKYNLKLLTKLVNNPNPFQSLLALKVADKTGFSIDDMKNLLKSNMLTMRNILSSQYLPEEHTNYLVVFINKYSDLPIELNKEILLKRLK